jgi:hypothetical protein
MTRIKRMSDKDKYLHAFMMVRLYQDHVLPFVEERLGNAALHHLRAIWQAAMMPVRKADPDEKKYEAAYNNWIWMARCSHDFLADLLKRDEVIAYKRLLLQLYKRQQDNLDVAVYRTFGIHSALVKAWAFEMQWITPIEKISQTDGQFTCYVKGCKVLQIPASARICRVDCRNVGSYLARRVYHLERKTKIVNQDCTMTLTPMEDEEE